MNLTRLRLATTLAVLVLMAAGMTLAQNNYTLVPITARDNAGAFDTSCTFGAHADAAYCMDTLTFNFGTLIEAEQPPKPPAEVFDIRFTSATGSADCLGQGIDLNFGHTGDTLSYKIEVQSQAFPVTLNWGKASPWIAADWQFLTIKDGFGGVFINVNMLTDTQLTMSNSLITALFITGRSNLPPTLDVKRDGEKIPQKFELQQNYPNPFNPSTEIRFGIEKTVFADIAVYNVIGQRVKTLAAETITPGWYIKTWNGTDDNNEPVTSGVYFVRMVATGEGVQFSDLRKLLLVK